MTSSEITVAEHLLIRFKQIGLDHLFGVPGDFVLGFFNQVLNSEVEYVGTCNELNAAYAADGYPPRSMMRRQSCLVAFCPPAWNAGR